MDTKWMGHCIWYALDHFSWTKISMCSMSLTRQMQCNITCLYFAARGSVQYMHLTTTHILAKSRIIMKISTTRSILVYAHETFLDSLCPFWKEQPNTLAFLRNRWAEKRPQRVTEGFFDNYLPLTFTLSNSLWHNFIKSNILGEGTMRKI